MRKNLSNSSIYRQVEGLDYTERDYAVVDLGFRSYHEYLESDLWRSIRQAVKRAHGGSRCRLCNKRKAIICHHYAYTLANLSGKSLEHIFVICRKCHKRVETTRGKIKRPLHEAQSVYRRKAKRSKWNGPRWCPSCNLNRSYQGGPCPPCLRRQERTLTGSSSTADRPRPRPDSEIPATRSRSEGVPDTPGATTARNQSQEQAL